MANFCTNQQRNIFNAYQRVEENDNDNGQNENGEIRVTRIPLAHNLRPDSLRHVLNMIGAPLDYTPAQLAAFLGRYNHVTWATNGYIMINIHMDMQHGPFDNEVDFHITLDDFEVDAMRALVHVALPQYVPDNTIEFINRVPINDYNLNIITLRLPRWNENMQYNMEVNNVR